MKGLRIHDRDVSPPPTPSYEMWSTSQAGRDDHIFSTNKIPTPLFSFWRGRWQVALKKLLLDADRRPLFPASDIKIGWFSTAGSVARMQRYFDCGEDTGLSAISASGVLSWAQRVCALFDWRFTLSSGRLRLAYGGPGGNFTLGFSKVMVEALKFTVTASSFQASKAYYLLVSPAVFCDDPQSSEIIWNRGGEGERAVLEIEERDAFNESHLALVSLPDSGLFTYEPNNLCFIPYQRFSIDSIRLNLVSAESGGEGNGKSLQERRIRLGPNFYAAANLEYLGGLGDRPRTRHVLLRSSPTTRSRDNSPLSFEASVNLRLTGGYEHFVFGLKSLSLPSNFRLIPPDILPLLTVTYQAPGGASSAVTRQVFSSSPPPLHLLEKFAFNFSTLEDISQRVDCRLATGSKYLTLKASEAGGGGGWIEFSPQLTNLMGFEKSRFEVGPAVKVLAAPAPFTYLPVLAHLKCDFAAPTQVNGLKKSIFFSFNLRELVSSCSPSRRTINVEPKHVQWHAVNGMYMDHLRFSIESEDGRALHLDELTNDETPETIISMEIKSLL